MPGELRDATVRTGIPGLNGGDITTAEFVALEARVIDIEGTTIPAVTTDLDDFSATPATAGQVPVHDGTDYVPTTLDLSHTMPFAVSIAAGGEATDPGAGRQGVVDILFDCTITGWTVYNRAAGSIEWDVFVGGVSITGTAKPKTTSALTGSSTTLTGWTTSVVAGTALEFLINSASGTEISTLNLHFERTI